MINEIKKNIEEFFFKMTTNLISLEVVADQNKNILEKDLDEDLKNKRDSISRENQEEIVVKIKIKEPQLFIGQNGQTLFDIQHLLAKILSKNLKKNIFLDLDINDYKKKKIEYLKTLARESADDVALSKKEKKLTPMLPYERRIIHLELAQRSDVFTESEGEGNNRYVIIKPR